MISIQITNIPENYTLHGKQATGDQVSEVVSAYINSTIAAMPVGQHFAVVIIEGETEEDIKEKITLAKNNKS